eukprot:446292_1
MDATLPLNSSGKSYGSINIDETIQEDNKYSEDENNASNDNRKKAWLSAETTIEEINVIQQYFQIEGYLTVFWKDDEFDSQKILSETKESHINKTKLDKLLDEYCTDHGHQRSQVKKQTEAEAPDTFKIRTIGKQDYIKLTKYIDTMQKKQYVFPFVSSSSREHKFIVFKNITEYELIGTNPVELDYNINNHVFKLHINFRCKLYECFENSDSAFPFEWQFLNAQIPYIINEYSFSSTCPDFVKRAYFHEKYWKNALDIWKHSILARKRDNVDEWKLLSPWIDLRQERLDYNYEFYFGLIKYRVVRNPNFYMLYIILPLCLMVSCSFAILLPIWTQSDESISDRLTYIITLLLTVAAFQISITSDLPYKSQFTLIDQYFLLAYLILAALVLEQSIVESLHFVDNEIAEIIEISFGCLLGLVWAMHTLTFIVKYFTYTGCRFSFDCSLWEDWEIILNFITCGLLNFIETLYECIVVTSCFCSKKRKKKMRLYKWMKMEKKEASSWDNTRKLKYMSHRAE